MQCRVVQIVCLMGATLLASPLFGQEKVASQPLEMLTHGTVNLDFRYRYEYVDQDGIDKHANASTLRSRIRLASAVYNGFSLLSELDNVSYIGDDDYNSTENGKTRYPVVADPKGSELNQLWIKYAYQALAGTYGRQRMDFGNQRFVGSVAWRQNDQTYDGLRGQWYGAHGLSLDTAYVYDVNRIFGPDDSDIQPSQLHGENYFFRGEWKVTETQALTAFSYILDIDDDTKYAPAKSVDNSSASYGIEYAGKLGPATAKAAYAHQSDSGDSRPNYDTNYYMLEGGVSVVGVNAHIGYEVLAADNGVGFKTPYATLHKFQGWADMFLVTPADGIEDLYGGVSGDLGPVNLAAIYHDFQAEDSSADFGSEIDLAATWTINPMWALQLNYASFSTDDETRYPDTEKVWAMVTFKY